MALVFNRLRYLWQRLVQAVGLGLLAASLLLLTSCDGDLASEVSPIAEPPELDFSPSRPALEQVDHPPELIAQLGALMDVYKPQIQILAPKPDQVLADTAVDIVLKVQDLPIYKDKTWDMGPHVELLVDNQPYGPIFDIEQPISLRELSPGTHTIRAFVVRPWNESFKNDGAYAQVTFHIFAKTDENSPRPEQPLLTYGSPVGHYGAEPVLLDFYLTNAPLHEAAQENPRISDWYVRYTLNGESLTLTDWESIYVNGLKPGRNWIQLTLMDEEGNPVAGVFNNTVRIVDYVPELNDSLARIIKNELTLADVGGIVDPTYVSPMDESPISETSDLPLDREDTAGSVEAETESPVGAMPMENGVEAETPSEEKPPRETSPKETPLEETPPVNQADTDKASQLEVESTSKLTESAPESVDNAPENLTDVASPTATFAEDLPEVSDITEDTEERSQPAEPSLTEDMKRSQPAEAEPSLTEDNALPGPEASPPESLESTSAPVPQEPEPQPEPATEPASSTRRYLQRLYDYRDRSMQTYGRDR